MRDELIALLDEHLREFEQPFQWGVRDCALFASSWVARATGQTLIPEHLHWHDEASANAAIATLGCSNMRDVADKFLERHTSPAEAMLGDIMGREYAFGFTLGICTGADVRVMDVRHGQVAVPRGKWSTAWKVC